MSKQATQSLESHRFNLRKLNELEVRKQYQVEITNIFSGLENLNEEENVNRIVGTLNIISKSQQKRVWVCTNGSSINPGLVKNV